ncbi:MAG: glycosyltransferase [Bacteroidales bacterium]|nr:glycosyltransferase [Bacteroidales bacterium]
MAIFFQILFWSGVFAIFHSYVLFPFILKLKAKDKKENTICYTLSDNLPKVSIILASYNEEKNIEHKIISTLETDYPSEKIEFLIGSDNSSDKTNEIIQKYAEKYKQIRFFPFNKRTGKTGIINYLKKETENDFLILTDTKVFFKKDTIFQLIKHFKNTNIKIVGGVLQNKKKNTDDISIQEDAYMKREMLIKYREGLVYGKSTGVFGAIYAIRKENLVDIPSNFTVDDFYVSMKVAEKNQIIIFEKNAVAEELITGNIKEEFKRKVRIATGNFQNMKTFLHILKKPFSGTAFCFFSHKIIRWTGPFILFFALISNLFLINILLYKITLLIFTVSFIIPPIDYMFKKIHINIKLFRYFTHFYGMNIALAIGFLKYIKGIESAVWEPSKR